MAQRYRARRPSNKPQVNQHLTFLTAGNDTGEPGSGRCRQPTARYPRRQPRDHQDQAGDPGLTKVSGAWTASKPIAPMVASASPVDLLIIVLGCPYGGANPARPSAGGNPYHSPPLDARIPGEDFRADMAALGCILPRQAGR